MARRITNGDETDAFDDKNVFAWRPGVRKAVKRRANRRERQQGRRALRAGSEA